MINIANEILDDAKKAYRESIELENEKLEDYLLKIIGDSKILLSKFNEVKIIKNRKKTKFSQSEPIDRIENEISKVKRRVPLWLTRKNQYNYIILDTYMKLSNNNKNAISVEMLEKNSKIDKFMTNYQQMKIIAEKNHAKIFDEVNNMVTLWEPVSDFIINKYKKKQVD